MSVSRRAPLHFALLACALFGCKDKSPASPSGLPPLGEEPPAAAPSLHSQFTHPPVGAQSGSTAGMPPGHPEVAPDEATPGDIPFDPKAVVSGELRLDGKMKSRVAPGDVIFLVARGAGEGDAPGPVLAVKKMNASSWPLPFTLDARDAMMSGTKLHGKVVVTARVDKDGDAISKNPGDVTGRSHAVDVPASKVVINLDTVL